MAVMQMLKYKPNQTMNDGPRIFTGNANEFMNWEFRTMVACRAAASEPEKFPKHAEKILQGLGGEALQRAKDFGLDRLMTQDGITDLVTDMREMVFPTLKTEIRTLYTVGTHPNGILARQPGEPMTSYIERRNQWWKLM